MNMKNLRYNKTLGKWIDIVGCSVILVELIYFSIKMLIIANK